jgi:hypothetical protein
MLLKTVRNIMNVFARNSKRGVILNANLKITVCDLQTPSFARGFFVV